jgi:16S rRNA processing protein RimM
MVCRGKYKFLPDLEEDQFYYHEISGFKIIDKSKGELGLVEAVVENPGHDLIIMGYLSKEVLIPITDNIVLLVDRDNKTVQVDLPIGLLELYLED